MRYSAFAIRVARPGGIAEGRVEHLPGGIDSFLSSMSFDIEMPEREPYVHEILIDQPNSWIAPKPHPPSPLRYNASSRKGTMSNGNGSWHSFPASN